MRLALTLQIPLVPSSGSRPQQALAVGLEPRVEGGLVLLADWIEPAGSKPEPLPYHLNQNVHPHYRYPHSPQLKAQSHQTSCDYVLTMLCSERDGRQKVLSRFKVLGILAHSGSSYYIQVVHTQFEPVLKNVVRTSLV